MKHFICRVGLRLVPLSLFALEMAGRAVQAADLFRLTEPLAIGRQAHTATLLQNGNVLVAGGVGGSGGAEIAGAEIFDPTTGQWLTAAPLAIARSGHTATVLPNGCVLIAGGHSGGAELAGAELFSPGTSAWQPTGGLAVARSGHTATLLPSGNVIVAGGIDSSGVALSSAEIYDPLTETWANAAALASARHHHTAVLLPNGNVHVHGGKNAAGMVGNDVDENPFAITLSGSGSNTAPTISAVSELTIGEDAQEQLVPIVIGDAESEASQLILTCATSDEALIPSTGIVLTVTGAQRTVTFVVPPNRSGPATLTVSVDDGELERVSSIQVPVLSSASSCSQISPALRRSAPELRAPEPA